MTDRIDTIDVRLLEILQEDGRATLGRIAEAVGLAESSVSNRIRRLEERGVITGYHARVDAHVTGRQILAFVRLSTGSSDGGERIVDAIGTKGEVQALHAITGKAAYLVKARTRDTTRLERLLARIQEISCVRETTTSVVLSTHKDSIELELEPTELVRG